MLEYPTALLLALGPIALETPGVQSSTVPIGVATLCRPMSMHHTACSFITQFAHSFGRWLSEGSCSTGVVKVLHSATEEPILQACFWGRDPQLVFGETSTLLPPVQA